MAMIQTPWATGHRSTPTAERAGNVMTQELSYTVKNGDTLAAADIVEMGILPAFHHIVDIQVYPEDAEVLIGLMTGETGVKDDTRTLGPNLIGHDGVMIPSVDYHRSIGMRVAADLVATEDTPITIVVKYAPYAA